MTAQPGPQPPAKGRNGRWEKLGTVSVDGACIAISDPAFLPGNHTGWKNYNTHSEPFGSGIQFWSGFGDGSYDIWAWIADYGEDSETDERIAQVVVTMIDAEDLEHWRSM